MNQPAGLRVRFWGVRGSLPTPYACYLRYGGNTSCLELRLPDGQALIFDAGSGIRALGVDLSGAQEPETSTHLFLTHFHWDHIAGIPFFGPLYSPRQQITFYGPGHVGSLQTILEGQMVSPYFSINLEAASARKEFRELGSSEAVQIGAAMVIPFPLNHPQGAVGYRIEAAGKVVVYATDYEHGHATLDRTLRQFAEGADLLICDSQYTPDEYGRHKGWGHSTWLEATRVACDARAKRLLLFHHDPARTDDQLDAVVEQARRCFATTDAAREGSSLCV
jgi:phosphoribosyl 1,2-cyclic phosphodiesterase